MEGCGTTSGRHTIVAVMAMLAVAVEDGVGVGELGGNGVKRGGQFVGRLLVLVW